MKGAITVKEGRKVATIDVPGAYLHARIVDDIILMRLDKDIVEILFEIDRDAYEPYINKDGSVIVQLDRALYGCIQSVKLWFE
jgi:hypothetical protein